jgi:hypothetical protein
MAAWMSEAAQLTAATARAQVEWWNSLENPYIGISYAR